MYYYLYFLLIITILTEINGQENDECWWTGCQLNSWAVVGCDEYGRIQADVKYCENGQKYYCCLPSSQAQNKEYCWWTKCRPSITDCGDYDSIERKQQICARGLQSYCCKTSSSNTINTSSVKKKTDHTPKPLNVAPLSHLTQIKPPEELNLKEEKEICGLIDESITKFDYDLQTRVIKPKATERGQFPWQVGLYRKYSSGLTYEQFTFFCSGSVVSKHHILTAAHCFEELHEFKYKAVTGDYTNNEKDTDEQEFLFKSDQVYIHPDYNSTIINNDIAIITIDSTINYDKYTKPICLPFGYMEYRSGLNCIISGWGHNGTDVETSTLQGAEVPIIQRNICGSSKVYGGRHIASTMFCAGNLDGGADACRGDSGGPLACEIMDEKSDIHRYIQFGIISWGEPECGQKPGVYTKVITYFDWIDQHIKDFGRIKETKKKKT